MKKHDAVVKVLTQVGIIVLLFAVITNRWA